MPITKVAGKKDGKQKYRVRVNYVDRRGSYRQVERTAYGLEEAKDLEMVLTKELRQSSPVSRLTVSELAEEYLESKRAELRETSYAKNVHLIKTYILPSMAEVRLDKLTVSILQNWKNEISGLDLSLRTRKTIYSMFRSVLNFAVRMDYISQNPLSKLGTFKETTQVKKEMLFYTPEEFRAFISSARAAAEASTEDYEWNYYVFFSIAFFTGARKGEILALTWNDISGDVIKITKSLSQTLKGADRITAPKNAASIRDIQIPMPLSNVLRDHLIRCQEYDSYSPEWFICGCLRPLRTTSIQNKLKTYAAVAGVKVIRVHDFRHSHASFLAHEGINVQEIARRLGHSKISTTLNTYSHLYPSEQERAVKALNSLKI